MTAWIRNGTYICSIKRWEAVKTGGKIVSCADDVLTILPFVKSIDSPNFHLENKWKLGEFIKGIKVIDKMERM